MDDTVKAETTIEFERWRPPNFATMAQDPSIAKTGEAQAVRVEKLSEAALTALAEAWLDDLFLKCTTRNPFTRTR